MYKILFVCTGNICRSPSAEGIMKKFLKENNLENKYHVSSAGTHAWHEGESPDLRSVSCAKSFGVDISNLKSKPVKRSDFVEYDMILAMDDRNISDLAHLSKNIEITAKIEKILKYAQSYGENVPDPYYNNGFDYVFEMISVAVENLVEYLEGNNI